MFCPPVGNVSLNVLFTGSKYILCGSKRGGNDRIHVVVFVLAQTNLNAIHLLGVNVAANVIPLVNHKDGFASSFCLLSEDGAV